MGEKAVVADPKFVDAAHGDYDLKPGSPALERGIGWRKAGGSAAE